MSAHTPGPWIMEINSEHVDIIRAYPDATPIAAIDTHDCFGVIGNLKEDIANGYLIASAPDMLAALRPFAELLEYPDEAPDGGLVTVTLCAEDIRRAIAAIAKAEGR